MMLLKYVGEFLYILSGLAALFAVTVLLLLLFFAPLGLGVYLGDVKGCADVVVYLVIISCYVTYYSVARHFGFLEGI